jgi:hypothetical protein
VNSKNIFTGVNKRLKHPMEKPLGETGLAGKFTGFVAFFI